MLNAGRMALSRFCVNSKASECVRLARELEKTFDLTRAVVVPRPYEEEKLPEAIGVATGNYLSEVLTDGMTIGLGWGETLSRSLKAVTPRSLRSCTVVSLLGALTKASAHNPSEFAWRFADLFGAECYFLAGPVYAPDEATRDGLFRHVGIGKWWNVRAGSISRWCPSVTCHRRPPLPAIIFCRKRI